MKTQKKVKDKGTTTVPPHVPLPSVGAFRVVGVYPNQLKVEITGVCKTSRVVSYIIHKH